MKSLIQNTVSKTITKFTSVTDILSIEAINGDAMKMADAKIKYSIPFRYIPVLSILSN